ncbi:MAG TPA: DNA replication/repair protein RecF [Polyangia bacterium]|nr:DNA replication/repair protein RecF [Polyangia bacterium]
MRIHALEARQFRNLEQVLLEPHPRFNVLSGDNGQGKTNVLEAIYLLGTLRSFRAGKTEEMVRFGAEQAKVRARVEKLETARLLEVTLAPGHKHARVDGKGARASDYFGGFNVVLFAPEDLRLPKGAPAGRRRFMDRAVWNAHPAYLGEVQTYEKVLRSRNAVLRDGGAVFGADGMLEVYDEQLARAAVAIVTRRRALVDELGPRVQAAFERVTQTGLGLTVAYETALDIGNIEHSMRDKLTAERRKDLARGATSSGPHVDDLELILDGKPARLYASQGQLRALVLALKIAEIEFLREKLGDSPVLLLDDVSSELDPKRNAQLFDFLKSVPCQAFITTTRAEYVLLTEERLDFRVVGGAVGR